MRPAVKRVGVGAAILGLVAVLYRWIRGHRENAAEEDVTTKAA